MKIRYLCCVILICLAFSAQAERYSVWVDETGEVHHAPVREKENPILKRARELEQRQQQSKEAKPDEIRSAVETQPLVGTSRSDQSGIADQSVRVMDSESMASEAQGEQPPISAPSAIEPPAQAHASDTPAAAPNSNSSMALPAVPLDDSDYVDAAELASRGFVRQAGEQRFYVWVDEQGVVHNSTFPDSNQGAIVPAPSLPVSPKPSPFQAEERLRPVIEQPLPVDDYAKTLLGLQQPQGGLLGHLAEGCCSMLPRKGIAELEWEDDYLLELDESLESAEFPTGVSPYQLIRLPEAPEDYLLRVRAFIKRGVFYPTLVFLDEDMRPVRLVRDLVHEFEPENWFRYGYLQGWVGVEAAQGETFLLVLALAEDFDKVTLVQHQERELQIPHLSRGLLHLSVIVQ